MLEQFLNCIVVTRQLFVTGDEAMDRIVARPTNRNRCLHFLPTEPFLKPLVRMTLSGNQMMLGRGILGLATA